MSVSTYLEIYLAQFGWSLYTMLWGIIVESGLAYLPFIGMFLRNIVEPIKSQEAKDASSTSLRRIEIDAATMFTVIVLAVQPFLSINSAHLNYTKACANNNPVSGGNTGTTYDDTFTQVAMGGTQARMPIWWYGVLAVTGGINDAAIVGIPCSTDIRLISYKITNARIEDPQLRNQVRQFYHDCYTPALTLFLDHNQAYPNHLPKEDLNWLGAEFFINGAYQTQRARSTVPGFSYDATRDLEYNPKIYIPQDGKPTCAQWWTGQGHSNQIGLRQALIGQVDAPFLADFETALAAMKGKSKQEVDDIALKTLIKREDTYFNGLQDLSLYNKNSLANAANSAAATVGGFMEAVSFYPSMYMMKTAAPVIQAVILMLIYMLMPFYMLFSSYHIGKIVFMSILVFSVKFWTVLWAVAHWLDNHLLEAIKPSWYQLDLTQNNMVASLVIDFVTAGLFVIVPLFWSGLLGWAGHRVGSEMATTANKMRDTLRCRRSKGRQ